MPLFDLITNEPELFAIRRSTCSENDVCACFAEDLLKNGELDDDRVLILKPDDYYNSKKIANRPPSVDCLILVKCTEQQHYDLYLIELRDVHTGTNNLKFKDISRKFETVLGDFFDRFQSVFSNVNIGKISLLLITNPYKSSTEQEYKSRFAGTAMDAYTSQRLTFGNKKYPIQPVSPNNTHIYPC